MHVRMFDRIAFRFIATVSIGTVLAISGEAYAAAGVTERGVLSRLVPAPRKVIVRDGSFAWRGQPVIMVEPGNEEDRCAAGTLEQACRARGAAIPTVVTSQEAAEAAKGGCILIGDPCRFWPLLAAMKAEKVSIPADAADEGYILLVTPERILVAANTAAGVYYGVQTLIQLLPDSNSLDIPAVQITDGTTLGLRGVMWDLYSGSVYKPEWMKENIRRLAHYKMNLVVLYFEDAFEFPSHPDIGENRDRLMFDEAKELDTFARRHHVQLMPCYESPGHMTNTLAHPNYRYLREGQDKGREAIINVTHPDTYPLLRDLYDDLCRAFSCPYVHMGGDEAIMLGMGESAATTKEVGQVHLYVRHVKRIREILAGHGRRMLVAGDPFEPDFFKPFGLTNYGLDGLKLVPRDVIIGPWHYGRVESFPFGDQLVERGFDQQLWTSDAAYYTLFPNQNAAAENVQSFVPYAHKLKAISAVHSTWNGPGENTFTEYNWPATAFYAEWAWSGRGRDWNDALPIVVETFYGPGTAALAGTIRALARTDSYFGWARIGMEEPAFKLFFRPIEPHRLGELAWPDRKEVEKRRIPVKDAMDQLAAFRRELARAQEDFETARQTAARNRDHLDYLAFAIAQQKALADLVECRHLLTEQSPANCRRLDELLRGLNKTFPPLCERYAELWLRVCKPRGLEPNRKRFELLRDDIRSRGQSTRPAG